MFVCLFFLIGFIEQFFLIFNEKKVCDTAQNSKNIPIQGSDADNIDSPVYVLCFKVFWPV